MFQLSRLWEVVCGGRGRKRTARWPSSASTHLASAAPSLRKGRSSAVPRAAAATEREREKGWTTMGAWHLVQRPPCCCSIGRNRRMAAGAAQRQAPDSAHSWPGTERIRLALPLLREPSKFRPTCLSKRAKDVWPRGFWTGDRVYGR